MRIALLCTSNDTSDFAKQHITDDIKYINLLSAIRDDWHYDCFPVWRNKFPENLDMYDGLIITGSPASVHDGEPWIDRLIMLIREAFTCGIAVFGGCFGHQAIAVAFGGKVDKNLSGNWSIGQEITAFNADAPYGLADARLSIYSIHKEEVIQLPAEAKAIGVNAMCKYPAFVIGDKVLTTQYHPEMTQEFLTELVEEMRGMLDDEILDRARAAFQKEHDGIRFAHAIVDFFEKADM